MSEHIIASISEPDVRLTAVQVRQLIEREMPTGLLDEIIEITVDTGPNGRADPAVTFRVSDDPILMSLAVAIEKALEEALAERGIIAALGISPSTGVPK